MTVAEPSCTTEESGVTLESALTWAMVIFFFFTVALYISYRVDIGSRRQAWGQIAYERRRLRLARELLAEEYARRMPSNLDVLDDYLDEEDPAED